MDRNLEGRVALVTGAARNLGRGFARMLAGHGASVVVHFHDDRSRPEAMETAASVEAAGSQAHVASGDLTNPDEVERIVGEAFARFGRLDVLVNNAGMIVKKPLGEVSNEEFDRIFALNAKAPFLLMREASRRMSDGGRIVNIGTSVLGASYPQYGLYGGSKAPMEHFTRALARELGPRGITVNTVAPGALDTAFFYGAETEESVEYVKRMTGGLGNVEDVVPVVEFLVSPGARWLTGQTLFVNGGVLTR